MADVVSLGTRMVAAFATLFLVGAWYFETVFRTNRSPFDLGDNWPIALIAFGGLLLIVRAGSPPGGGRQDAAELTATGHEPIKHLVRRATLGYSYNRRRDARTEGRTVGGDFFTR